MTAPLRDTKGAVSVPLLLITVTLVGAMLTLLGLSLQWRARVTTQKRIDDCVAQHARELKETITSIERGNLRIQVERAAMVASLAAGPVAPAAIRAFKAVIRVEVLYQETLRAKWGLRQLAWIAKRGCDSKRDAFFPLPRMAWKRPPPDVISEQPLEWEPGQPKSLRIRLWKHPRYATALVENTRDRWNARWVSPLGK